MNTKQHSLFITGTGTDVGKTYLSAWILFLAKQLDLKSQYFKPVQCGLDPSTNPPESDAQKVGRLSGFNEFCETGVFLEAPVSPHLAFKKAGLSFDLKNFYEESLSFIKKNDLTLIEGAGGIEVPLNKEFNMADLAKAIQMKNPKAQTLVVASPLLGTLNHTLLTIKSLKTQNIKVGGFIFSRPQNIFSNLELEIFLDSAQEIEERTGVLFLGMTPYFEKDLNYADFKTHPLYKFLESL